MDEAHQILLLGLERSGIVLPPGVSNIHDVNPVGFMSICSQAISLVQRDQDMADMVPSYLPGTLPQSTSERFRLCSMLAAAIKQLGYRTDINFHQFLYPSEVDIHEVLRFLFQSISKVAPLSQADKSRKVQSVIIKRSPVKSSNFGINTRVRQALSQWLEEASTSIGSERPVDAIKSLPNDILQPSVVTQPFRTCPLRLAKADMLKKSPPLVTLQAKPKEWIAASILELNAHQLAQQESNIKSPIGELDARVQQDVVTHGILASNRAAHHGRALSHSDAGSEMPMPSELEMLEERCFALSKQIEQVTIKLEVAEQELLQLDKDLESELESNISLERKIALTRGTTDVATTSPCSPELSIEHLEKSLEGAAQKSEAANTKLEALHENLEQNRQDLELSAQMDSLEMLERVNQIKVMRTEAKEMASKVTSRKHEYDLLVAELKTSVKQTSRSTYLRRIRELIKNSKKQDADISRIISETRILQRESNGIQDRLRRIHAVVDEIVFRDAKRDSMRRQAYRLLTTVHESFSDIVERVFDIDKLGRDIADLEAKLEIMVKQPVDLASVQADLAVIIEGNRLLEDVLTYPSKDVNNVNH